MAKFRKAITFADKAKSEPWRCTASALTAKARLLCRPSAVADCEATISRHSRHACPSAMAQPCMYACRARSQLKAEAPMPTHTYDHEHLIPPLGCAAAVILALAEKTERQGRTVRPCTHYKTYIRCMAVHVFRVSQAGTSQQLGES